MCPADINVRKQNYQKPPSLSLCLCISLLHTIFCLKIHYYTYYYSYNNFFFLSLPVQALESLRNDTALLDNQISYHQMMYASLSCSQALRNCSNATRPCNNTILCTFLVGHISAMTKLRSKLGQILVSTELFFFLIFSACSNLPIICHFSCLRMDKLKSVKVRETLHSR